MADRPQPKSYAQVEQELSKDEILHDLIVTKINNALPDAVKTARRTAYVSFSEKTEISQPMRNRIISEYANLKGGGWLVSFRDDEHYGETKITIAAPSSGGNMNQWG